MHRKEKRVRWKENNTFLSILFCLLVLSAHGFAQEKKVSLNCKGMRLSEALIQVERQSEHKLSFNFDELSQFNVTVNIKKKTVIEAIENLLHGLPYQTKVSGQFITIFRRNVQRQTSSPTRGGDYTIIRGKVVDTSDKPLPGVNISFKNRNYGTVTDINGNYAISVDKGARETMLFSFIGMKTEVLTVNCNAEEKILNLTLKEGDGQLNEVVVTGIFNKPKVSFTGAATIISSDQIKALGNRNLLKTLSNIDPSFDLQENNAKGSDPNQTLNIEIRGSATIGSVNEMQSNVRNQRNLPLFILDGFEVTSERVMDMNQDDVESVVILKDASATAIYGSRGANGVVVISSKRPELGRVRVNYSTGMNLEIPDLSSYDLMNSFEKLEVEKAAGLYTNTSLATQLQLDALYNEHLKAASEGVNTNWMKIPVRVGLGQFHKLDINGGVDQFRYILNVSYNQLTGSMKGSKRDNLNGNMTISYLMKKVRFTNTLSVGFNNAANSTYGNFSQYASMNPYWRPYNEKGEPIASYTLFTATSPLYNPLYDAAQTSFNTSDYTNIRNTTMLDADLMPNVRANVNIGFTQQRGGSDYFVSPKASTYLQSGTDVSDRGNYIQKTNKMTSYQMSGTINWAKVYGEHSIYVGANYQVMETKNNSTSMSVKGFMNDQMTDVSNANKYSGEKPTTDESTVRSMGFTGTINYSYAQRYFFDVSFREDAASSFGSESRWAPFYSLGVGWEIAQEKWMRKLLPVVNMAKFRYSYGVTGSLSFSPYDALTTYKYNNNTQYNYLIGASVNSFGNPSLKWQNTVEHNFGLDLGLLNRFTLNFNYYRKTTENLLSDAYLPLSHGYTTYKENLGEIRNTGYDLSLSYTILRYSNDHPIDWSIRAGFYHNTNVLVKLSEAIKKANEFYSNSNYSGGTINEYREGQSLDEIYVLQSAGVDPQTGKRLYIDTDGTITMNASGLNKVAVGSSQPKVNGRFGTGFRWKGLNVDLSFGARIGGKKLNSTLMSKVENAVVIYNQDRRVISQRWRKPGDVTAFKSLSGEIDNSFPNNLFVFTENTFTFNNANISYDFPLSWIQRFGMSRLSIGGSLSDIFYISNIKQERGTDYPYSIKPTFTFSCTF
ncbi:SusC/RagA family TonB-linked outer membrane protein [Bacteroides reticulotermitis]|uniref:TonB-dependent receptor n=2 Tax=Bacteroides reticulotermitis TaxID=1133319 RepID=W4UT24_9BACE|nr:SusC/RagA family TonB-linked outer membrane protein [Bacteroides reticulotermitis]MBB4045247.1 TonB-linked SusC/RagA family outer membrane protein [Bacteroides reticulotermitis]GAE84091.1 TonB-dependent receptor [Bacteroides reticulotermitis JCM 10512]